MKALLRRFLGTPGRKQVLSLGGGLDTTFFRLRERGLLPRTDHVRRLVRVRPRVRSGAALPLQAAHHVRPPARRLFEDNQWEIDFVAEMRGGALAKIPFCAQHHPRRL